MEYVVVEIGGKQYKVQSGDVIEVDRIKDTTGIISLDKVLLHVSDANVNIGKPYIADLVVSAKVLDQLKGDKLRVARFTAKSRHRRVIGFRASLTRLQIEGISASKLTPAKKVAAKTTAKAKEAR